MNISNYYWYFSGVLTPRFCDDVIAYANAQKETMAITSGYGRERELDKISFSNLSRSMSQFLGIATSP